jgi:hypothetical protein
LDLVRDRREPVADNDRIPKWSEEDPEREERNWLLILGRRHLERVLRVY